jgi:hypothetical protein
MAKYLVVKTTYFVDPHGTPDEGGVEKFITTDKYEPTPKGKYTQHDEHVDEDDLYGSEDGYNSEAYKYKVRELKPDEVQEVLTVIKAYDKLK